MSKKATWIIVGVVVVIAVVAGVLVTTNSSSTPEEEEHTNHTSSASDTSSNSTNSTSDMSDMSSSVVATDTVQIKDYMFDPMSITIKVGTTVTWTNKDSVRHNVASDTPSSDSPDGPLLAQGESYKFTFTKPGTYKVHCTPHPYMKQTITVTE